MTSGKIEQGNSLTLICKSNANPAVTNYTWFRIRDANISSIGFDCEFSIKAASQKDDGQYFCTAKNDMGSQNSTIVALKFKGNREYFIFLVFGMEHYSLMYPLFVCLFLQYLIDISCCLQQLCFSL